MFEKLKNAFNSLSAISVDEFVTAAYDGDIGTVSEFLGKNKSNIDAAADNGWTALTAAAVNGHLKVVQLLLESGALIDQRNNGNRTALMLAALQGHKNIVDYLFKQGASIGEKDHLDMTALDWANLGHDDTGSVDTAKVVALLEDAEKFSPALKRSIPLPKPFRFSKNPKATH